MAIHQGVHQERSLARKRALQLLYQSEVTNTSVKQILDETLYVEEVGLICDFTCLLLEGINEHKDQIDKLIVQTSENWSLERMPIVDRSILRLATFEMLYAKNVPFSVSINEAVELAKDFGGEDESSRFVNGVLGKIADYLAATIETESEKKDRDE